jgi:hypothetical protein
MAYVLAGMRPSAWAFEHSFFVPAALAQERASAYGAFPIVEAFDGHT